MTEKGICHSTIYSYDCPLYLRPNSFNSRTFAVCKEANRRPWCLLYDEPCTGTPMSCGLMRHYKLKITITADAKLLDFVESPNTLIVPIREFVYRTLGFCGEHPTVIIDYEKDHEKDDWYMIDRVETLELLKNLSERNPGIKHFKEFCDVYEKEEEEND